MNVLLKRRWFCPTIRSAFESCIVISERNLDSFHTDNTVHERHPSTMSGRRSSARVQKILQHAERMPLEQCHPLINQICGDLRPSSMRSSVETLTPCSSPSHDDTACGSSGHRSKFTS